jgi:hypothetical protein
MLRRCYKPTDHHYPDYGGRGITVCAKWLGSFEAFLADMGEAPTPKHSIDRIDNNVGYSPENCRWASPSEQARNKRNTRMMECNGVTKPLAEWAEITGLTQKQIWSRLRHGWSDSDAITRPLRE